MLDTGKPSRYSEYTYTASAVRSHEEVDPSRGLSGNSPVTVDAGVLKDANETPLVMLQVHNQQVLLTPLQALKVVEGLAAATQNVVGWHYELGRRQAKRRKARQRGTEAALLRGAG
jgi:hypothetical protein